MSFFANGMKNFIWIGILVVVLIAIIALSSKGTEIKPLFEVGVVHPLDNVKGNIGSSGQATSSVLIIEYGDFQCPACRSYYSIMKELVTEFGDKITFVYRNFPLIEIHSNAEFAARAVQAAAKQGKFWQMHDLLFEKQAEWSKTADIESVFESYAALIGISVEQFKKDWLSKEIKDFVKAQRSRAIKLGLKGTPSFFVNGIQIQNPNSIETFKSLIKSAIEKK